MTTHKDRNHARHVSAVGACAHADHCQHPRCIEDLEKIGLSSGTVPRVLRDQKAGEGRLPRDAAAISGSTLGRLQLH